MTDEMNIQQRPSAVPYLAGGALVGGVGSYFGAPKIETVRKWISEPAKYNSYEDLVKEAKDTTTFSSAIEKASAEEKPLMEKLAAAVKTDAEAVAKWDADFEKFKEAYKEGGLAPLEEGNELLAKQKELETKIANLEKETAAGATGKAADPAKVRNVKSLLEKEVQLRETATKELNKEIQAAAIKKFEAISQIEALEEGIRELQRNNATEDAIKEAKNNLKDARKAFENTEKEIAKELEKEIIKDYKLSGKAGKKAAEAKTKEILTQIQDIIAEKTHNEAIISTKPVITAEANALNEIKKFGDKDLIKLAEKYKNNPAEHAKTIGRTISAEKLKLNKLTEFQNLYKEAVKTAPAGESQVVEQLKILFGLVNKTKTTTVTPEVQAIEKAFQGMEEKAQNDLMRILGKNSFDTEGIQKAIEGQNGKIKALESTKTAVDNYHKLLVEIGGEGAYVKNGVLYAKDGKAAALKMEEISLSAKEIAVPKSGKEISLEKQLAQMGEVSETTLTKEQLATKTKELETLRTQLKGVEGDITKAREALPRNAAKTQEQLMEEFVKKNGARSEIENKTVNSVKDDLARFFEGKINNKKFAAAVAGTAAVGALLALAFRPSNKQA